MITHFITICVDLAHCFIDTGCLIHRKVKKYTDITSETGVSMWSK